MASNACDEFYSAAQSLASLSHLAEDEADRVYQRADAPTASQLNLVELQRVIARDAQRLCDRIEESGDEYWLRKK